MHLYLKAIEARQLTKQASPLHVMRRQAAYQKPDKTKIAKIYSHDQRWATSFRLHRISSQITCISENTKHNLKKNASYINQIV